MAQINEFSCIHIWNIESPNGRFSEGVCKKCGEIKNFINFIEEDSAWGNPKGPRKKKKADLDIIEENVIDF